MGKWCPLTKECRVSQTGHTSLLMIIVCWHIPLSIVVKLHSLGSLLHVSLLLLLNIESSLPHAELLWVEWSIHTCKGCPGSFRSWYVMWSWIHSIFSEFNCDIVCGIITYINGFSWNYCWLLRRTTNEDCRRLAG